MLLLLVFGLSSAAPLLALVTAQEVSVPACCRRAGAHHCLESMTMRRSLDPAQARFSAPPMHCPFFPQALSASHAPVLAAPAAALHGSMPAMAPAGVQQAECRWRIARDRSRQKRGPPSHRLS
ncbi:hypothetical protein D1Y84_10820 [Acidipila sp. EB88]|nr:hypothetical protein D1Y84_10820 [Acidipila sp. EB88]